MGDSIYCYSDSQQTDCNLQPSPPWLNKLLNNRWSASPKHVSSRQKKPAKTYVFISFHMLVEIAIVSWHCGARICRSMTWNKLMVYECGRGFLSFQLYFAQTRDSVLCRVSKCWHLNRCQKVACGAPLMAWEYWFVVLIHGLSLPPIWVNLGIAAPHTTENIVYRPIMPVKSAYAFDNAHGTD